MFERKLTFDLIDQDGYTENDLFDTSILLRKLFSARLSRAFCDHHEVSMFPQRWEEICWPRVTQPRHRLETSMVSLAQKKKDQTFAVKF